MYHSKSIILKTGSATGEMCELCHQKIIDGIQVQVEDRPTWFRGDDEIYFAHKSCNDKANAKIKVREDAEDRARESREEAYEKRIRPKWDFLEGELKKNGISVKEYPDTGQWCFDNTIDWWTTTGTAIHRKTKERFSFSIESPKRIIDVLKIKLKK